MSSFIFVTTVRLNSFKFPSNVKYTTPVDVVVVVVVNGNAIVGTAVVTGGYVGALYTNG
jgi:hypothetical protein